MKIACLSNFIFDLQVILAAYLSDPKVCAPISAVLALANVIRRPIYLFTKQIIEQRLISV